MRYIKSCGGTILLNTDYISCWHIEYNPYASIPQLGILADIPSWEIHVRLKGDEIKKILIKTLSGTKEIVPDLEEVVRDIMSGALEV